MKKKRTAFMALLLALVLVLPGCNLMKNDTVLDTTYVMTTFYPIYALAVNITQDIPSLSLSNLVQPQNGCLRSYALSDWDAALIARQDALIIGGRGLESFESALTGAASGPIVVNAMSGLTLRDNGDEPDTEESTHLDGPNPWLFMSVPGAIEITLSIAYGLAQADSLFADQYMANMNAYVARLEALAGDMADELAGAPSRPVAILHEGLGYFADQLGLNVAKELAREPGTEQIDNDLEQLLSDLADSGAEIVLIEKQAPAALVEALTNAGYTVALLDTLTTHTADGDVSAYERIMLNNAKVTAAALRQAAN